MEWNVMSIIINQIDFIFNIDGMEYNVKTHFKNYTLNSYILIKSKSYYMGKMQLQLLIFIFNYYFYHKHFFTRISFSIIL